MNPTRGQLIVVEGPNLSGKTTFIAQLKARYGAAGFPVLLTREPGGTKFGEYLREALKTTEGVSDFARALAMNASRAQKQVEVTLPALARGEIVLCDRYCTSTRVFQQELGSLTSSETEIVEAIHNSMLRPDLTIYLMPTLRLLQERARRSNRTGDKDVFENNIITELAAYERVLAKEIATGAPTAVLRFDEDCGEGLIDRLQRVTPEGISVVVKRRASVVR